MPTIPYGRASNAPRGDDIGGGSWEGAFLTFARHVNPVSTMGLDADAATALFQLRQVRILLLVLLLGSRFIAIVLLRGVAPAWHPDAKAS